MTQIENAANIAKFKYSSDRYTVLWLFDQRSCHRKYDEHALLTKNILVKDGGPRRVRDRVWEATTTNVTRKRCCKKIANNPP